MSFRSLTPWILGLAVALAPLSVRAESNGWVTLGVGAGLTISSPPGDAGSTATDFNLNARLKMLKFLGVDLMYAPRAGQYAQGDDAPALRLTALLYILNFRAFSLFGAAGLTGLDFGDLVDVQGTETRYRAGGGVEVTFSGHYSLGIEGYWLVPGVGMVEQQVKAAFEEGGEVMTADEAFPTDGYELFIGVRYFF